MAKKTVELEMKVQDATKSGLSSVEKNIEQAKAKISTVQPGKLATASADLNAQLGRAGAAMAQVAAAATAVEIGIMAASAAAGYFSGDLERQQKAIESIDQAMKTLPFGFNKIYSIGTKINDLLTGEVSAVEKINGETERRNKQLETTSKLLADHKKLVSELNAEASKNLGNASTRYGSVRDRIDSIILSQNPQDFGLARGIENRKINNDIDAQRKVIADIAADDKRIQDELGTTGSWKRVEELEAARKANAEALALAKATIHQLEELRLQSLAKIDNEEKNYIKKKAEAEKDAFARSEAEKLKIAEDAMKRKRALEDAFAGFKQSISDSERDHEIEALRMVGEKRKADQLQIQRDFDEQIRQAQEAARRAREAGVDASTVDAGLADATRVATERRDLRNYQLNKPTDQQTPDLAMRSSRFLTGATDVRPEVKQQKTLEEILAEMKKANEMEQRRLQVAENARQLNLEIGNGD